MGDHNKNNIKNRERMQISRKIQTPEDRIRCSMELKDRMQNLRKKQIKNKTDLDRLLAFRTATRYGAIFICSSCHQKMFANNTSILDENMKNQMKKR